MVFTISILLVTIVGTLGYQNDGCASNHFSCRDQSCILKKHWCDGVSNCHNNYDEIYCNRRRNETHPIICPQGMMACQIEGCVPLKARCDGIYSCKDGFDERDCGPRSRADPPPRTRPAEASIIPDVEDFDHDYEDEDKNYEKNKKKAIEWLLKQRKDYAWGDDTERAIVALSLSKEADYGEDSEKDGMLMIKSLHLKISLALAKNIHTLSLGRRALLIYALIASCGNPRNFYGVNLVGDLRGSVNKWYRERVYAAPIVYLTLCLTNQSDSADIERISIEASSLTANSKSDLKALFLLTIVCMETRKIHDSNKETLFRIKRYLVKDLVKSDAENIYELALVTQALNAARVNPETWGRYEKMKSIVDHQDEEGSFRDMLATYYVLPLLSRKSLLSVGEHCDQMAQNDSASMETLRRSNEIRVNYTLNFGPQNVSQTMFLTVMKGMTLYEVMNYAAKRNVNFRFSWEDKKNSGPLVYSIGGSPNDAEKGFFWDVDVSRKDRRYDTPVTNIKTYELQDGDSILFAMKFYHYR